MKHYQKIYTLLPAALSLWMMACTAGSSGGNGGANDTSVVMNSPQKAVEVALRDLQQVTDATVKTFGFASVAEAKEAKAEEPVKLQVLSFDKLLAADSSVAGDSLNPLSRYEETSQQELVYPLAVGGAIKSTVKIAGMSERWQIAGFDQGHAKVLDNARKLSQGQAFGLVTVPGLQLAFIATNPGGRALYYPVQTDETVGVYKDRPVSAYELIRLVSGAARAAKEKYGKDIDSRNIVN
ncbi:hypothetical protein MKQ68_20400 [Chitinophaga horti]|uniref:Uncharacterized protein n=1 Tax=Chitinophaga horti TaxID=2920382 RepID=A0ABY6IYG9_9BACT|nr:hypothetical protein [Chitinophaga horti]UYQ92448.1 hypothetical protein MKQ68_20400 [Chitinophaga horti]